MSTLKIKRENGKIFCPLADSWHIETPEEKVRQEYIKILVEDYGYSLDQMAQEIKVNNSQRGQGKARADIVIWKSKQDKIESKAAFIVVECKAENVRIRAHSRKTISSACRSGRLSANPRSSSGFPFAFAPLYFLLYCVPADQYFRSKILR